jgi:hypothetical protein
MKRLVFAAILIAALPLIAQTPKPAAKAAKGYTAPKTPWGDPDLQGQWPATANIPLQRPANLGNRATLTPEELKQREAQAAQQAEGDSEEFTSSKDSVSINPPGYWVERGKPHAQASLVVDPPNGRIPALTPAGQAYAKSLRNGLGPGSHFPEKVDTWEDFDFYSRCITRGLVSSMLPTLYNFGNQIVQAPGYVAIRNEMIHETRVIPLDGRAHVGKSLRAYMGDSRGHWEGDTLVVDTTNYKPRAFMSVSSEKLHVTERFTRTGPEVLKYEITISDPDVWTKPWSLMIPLRRSSLPVYEYACHEGNEGLIGILAGARAQDKAAKAR